MKIKYLLLIFFINLISCNINYESIYNQEYLKISDCKNIKLVNWILFKETGIKINQKIQIIFTDYNGGIPLHIKGLPIYYIVDINEKQYNIYKNKILNSEYSEYWRFNNENEEFDFIKVTKFELSCILTKNNILFGYRNIEGIAP